VKIFGIQILKSGQKKNNGRLSIIRKIYSIFEDLQAIDGLNLWI